MEAIHIHTFTSFIFNTSTKEINDVFKTLPDWQLEALQQKENELRKKHKSQNRLVWLELIAIMDDQQLSILAKYIDSTFID